jgi:hypothetical protein
MSGIMILIRGYCVDAVSLPCRHGSNWTKPHSLAASGVVTQVQGTETNHRVHNLFADVNIPCCVCKEIGNICLWQWAICSSVLSVWVRRNVDLLTIPLRPLSQFLLSLFLFCTLLPPAVDRRKLQEGGRIVCHPLSLWLLAWIYSSTLKVEAACCFEMSVDFHLITRRYMQEDRGLGIFLCLYLLLNHLCTIILSLYSLSCKFTIPCRFWQSDCTLSVYMVCPGLSIKTSWPESASKLYQPSDRLVSTIEELLGQKSSGSGLENREYGRRDPLCCPRNTLYPQTLALTSPASGSRSQTKGHCVWWCMMYDSQRNLMSVNIYRFLCKGTWRLQPPLCV